MTQSEFMSLLKSELSSKGLDEEQINKKCESVLNNLNKLPENDAAKYYTESNAKIVAERLMNDSAADQGKPTLVISKTETLNSSLNENSQRTVVTDNTDVVFHTNRDNQNEKSKDRSVKADITNRITNNSYIVWILLALCFPVILLLAVTIIGLSLGVAFAMAGIIIVIVCLITGIVAGGSVLSVLSLVYGITQIITEPRYIGLHEIGLALVFAGITMLISVLLYNLAVRFIPALYKLIGIGLRKLAAKSKVWFELVKKGCKNL